MKQNETQFSQQPANKYNCKLCDYTTCNKWDFNKHILTRKHVKNVNETRLKQNETILPEKSVNLLCSCGLLFNSRTTMWRHKKKCTKETSVDVSSHVNVVKENQPVNLITNELVIELLKDNKEMKQLIVELVKNGITSANSNNTNSNNTNSNERIAYQLQRDEYNQNISNNKLRQEYNNRLLAIRLQRMYNNEK